jgi:hypothetical protein
MALKDSAVTTPIVPQKPTSESSASSRRIFHQPPDKLGPEQIRQYQAYLFQSKSYPQPRSRSTCPPPSAPAGITRLPAEAHRRRTCR